MCEVESSARPARGDPPGHQPALDSTVSPGWARIYAIVEKKIGTMVILLPDLKDPGMILPSENEKEKCRSASVLLLDSIYT